MSQVVVTSLQIITLPDNENSLPIMVNGVTCKSEIRDPNGRILAVMDNGDRAAFHIKKRFGRKPRWERMRI
jgi:hypothetical protein